MARYNPFVSLAHTSKEQERLVFGIVFFAYFLTAVLEQYLSSSYHLPYSLIWAPIGIGLASIIVWGYRMWIPIALAAFIAAFVTHAYPNLFVVLMATVGYTLQPIVGAYLLRQSDTLPEQRHTTKTILFITTSVFTAAIGPTVVLGTYFVSHTLSPIGSSLLTNWSAAWAGGIASILVITPFITTIPRTLHTKFSERQLAEAGAAMVCLVISIYFLFWTSIAQTVSFPLICVLFIVLFWITLRFEFPLTTVALFVMSLETIAGTLIAHPGPLPLQQQVLNDEWFILFSAPIFLLFSGIVRELQDALKGLAGDIGALQKDVAKMSSDDRAKNEFIAILAHELRNPLAPILSTFELLRSHGDIDGESLRLVSAAENQANVMRHLLDDLLDVARISQQTFKLQKEKMEIHPLIAHCIDSTQSFMRSRGHALLVSLPEEDIWLDIDPVRIEQVVVNLLNNSGKYTPPGGRIEIGCSKDHATCTIWVRDNGTGIEAHKLQEIFQPFRNMKSAPIVGTGLGIGLSITKRLVEMHGGTIEARSDGVAQGSLFTVKLPLSTAPVPSPAPLLKAPKKKRFSKILVVDDNVAAAQSLGTLLSLKGYNVSFAYNGVQALKEASVLKPHVILLDIGLPDMDGYNVARLIRASKKQVPVFIALTGYGQEEDKVRAKDAGFEHHLTKPVRISELEELLTQPKKRGIRGTKRATSLFSYPRSNRM